MYGKNCAFNKLIKTWVSVTIYIVSYIHYEGDEKYINKRKNNNTWFLKDIVYKFL